MNTWTHGNIAMVKDGGDFEKALKSIKAKGLIMPSKTDLYFPVSAQVVHAPTRHSLIQCAMQKPEDSEYEVAHLPNSKLVVIDTVWGHMSGGGECEEDIKFMQEQIEEFLLSWSCTHWPDCVHYVGWWISVPV